MEPRGGHSRRLGVRPRGQNSRDRASDFALRNRQCNVQVVTFDFDQSNFEVQFFNQSTASYHLSRARGNYTKIIQTLISFRMRNRQSDIKLYPTETLSRFFVFDN